MVACPHIHGSHLCGEGLCRQDLSEAEREAERTRCCTHSNFQAKLPLFQFYRLPLPTLILVATGPLESSLKEVKLKNTVLWTNCAEWTTIGDHPPVYLSSEDLSHPDGTYWIHNKDTLLTIGYMKWNQSWLKQFDSAVIQYLFSLDLLLLIANQSKWIILE